jgi:FkbM family methyltransferase
MFILNSLNILKIFQSLDQSINYLFSNKVDESLILKKIFKKKKINFVDIGANVGAYYDYVNKKINLNKAYLFEPNIKCFSYLKNRYKKNGVIIENLGILNKSKKLFFYEYSTSSNSGFLKRNNIYYDSLTKFVKKYKISLVKFDDYFINKKIDFCKIDTEGSEFSVIQSMRKSLKKIKLIKIEINFLNNMWINKKTDFIKVINFFYKNNFFLYSISKIKFVDNRVLFIDAFFLNNN